MGERSETRKWKGDGRACWESGMEEVVKGDVFDRKSGKSRGRTKLGGNLTQKTSGRDQAALALGLFALDGHWPALPPGEQGCAGLPRPPLRAR